MEGKRKLEEKNQVGGFCKRRDIDPAVRVDGDQEDVPTDDFCSELLVDSSSLGEMDLEGEEAGEDERVRFDSNHLLSIFPEEIWRMLLKTVSDPDALETISNTSPFFRKLLEDKRVLFLFPKVWTILAAKYHENRNTDNSFNEARSDVMVTSCCGHYPNPKYLTEPCKICGRLHALRWYSGILRLRLVCQSWSSVIDQLLQQQAGEYEWADEPQSRVFNKRIGHWISYSIMELDQTPQQFMNHFDGTHYQALIRRNPFLNRRISLFYCFSNAMLEYYLQVAIILNRYGDHLWYSSITVEFLSQQAAYLVILRMLRLLPNLKVLSVDYPPPYLDNSIPGLIHGIRETIQTYPMPAMQNLKFLQVSRLPTRILNELIRVNSHLSVLEIGECGPQPVSAIFSTPMPNLTQLALKIHSEAEIQLLESSPQVTWQLQKLYLDFHYLGGTFQRIFSLLEEKWSNTLTELIFSIPPPELHAQTARILEECKSSALNLPNLKRLGVLMPGFFSLDWILPMKDTLESLDVTVPFNGDISGQENKLLILAADEKQLVKFFCFGDRPLESSIWNLLPKLREVTFNKAGDRFGRNFKIKQWAYTRANWMNRRNL